MQSETIHPSASRQLWADFIRGIGILLVILGHVSGMVVQRWQDVQRIDWTNGNYYNVIARSCVPLLFMVSGALLLPKQESLKDFYRKRFNKVIYPFLFWSVLYLLKKMGCFELAGSFGAWQQACFGEYTLINFLKTIVMRILTAPAEYHLWFMYELFAIYLVTPVLRVLAVDGREKYLWYLLAIWFVFGPLQRMVQSYLGFELIFDLGYLTGYIGYFIAGYLLTRIRIGRPVIWIAVIGYISMAYFTGNITFELSRQAGRLVDFYQYLLGLNIVILSSSLYILLRALGERIFSVPRPWLGKVAVNLTSASFGMYLVHVFVLTYLSKNYISPLNGSALLMIPMTTLAVFVISWVIIAILQKIPYLRALIA